MTCVTRFGIRLAEAGCSEATIADLMGHSDPQLRDATLTRLTELSELRWKQCASATILPQNRISTTDRRTRLDYIADRPSRSNREGRTKFRSNEGNWSIAERSNGVGQEGAFLTICVYLPPAHLWQDCGR
jgi:hypothetical protein